MIDCRHVIFDWNGTLIDDVGLAVACINSFLPAYGLPEIDRGLYRSRFRFPIRDFYEELGFDFASTSFQDIVDDYMRVFTPGLRTCSLQPGAIDLLEWIKARGVPMSILSAMQQDDLEASVAHQKLGGHFSHVVGIDTQHADSKLGAARRLEAELREDPGNVAYIGDTMHDVEVGREIGWRMCIVSNGHHDWKSPGDDAASVVSDLRAVQDLLK